MSGSVLHLDKKYTGQCQVPLPVLNKANYLCTSQTRIPREVSEVRVRWDVNISSVHNVIYRISLYTMFLVPFFVSNAPSEVVSMCRRGFYIADAVFQEWHYASQR